MYNPFSLEGKTILVTGASSGIGRATAIECSRMGARIVVTARNEQRLKDTFDRLEGPGHVMILADLTNEDDLISLAEKTPPLDGVVNNAGISSVKLVAFYSMEELQKVFSINTFAPMLTIRWLLKKKKINKNASLVFTSSVAALGQSYGNGIYGSSKAALTAYMRYCTNELAIKGIRANAVQPALVETEFLTSFTHTEEPQTFQKCLQSYLLGRLGRPEDVAYAIIYFLSDASCWVTGTVLSLTGGTNNF